MARLELMTEDQREYLLKLPCPIYESNPWIAGPPLNQRRVALISTAGVHKRNDRPFEMGATGYRIIPSDTSSDDLIMSHISANFDRTGFQQDWNVVFPIDRLRELVANGSIGSIAQYHYSFMGATDPRQMESTARSLAGIIKNDGVNAVLLVPV
jgi:D-proline reductase (dithiol) PrdB